MERFASISNIIETAFSSIIIMNNLIKKIHVSNSIHIKKKKKKKKKKNKKKNKKKKKKKKKKKTVIVS